MKDLFLAIRIGGLLLAACGLVACGGAEREGAAATTADATAEVLGELTYRRFCFSCHASGAAGAPRVGQASAWEARVAAGMDVMLRHTIEGMPGMPPRGMCRQCSDDELRDAITYMVERSLPN
ncbi:MAG: cytochrome c5 family protein [Gammaproteobacteria bacterium]|nr:cytochrome c5 family protein [Gammaproteobacteria bacterium]